MIDTRQSYGDGAAQRRRNLARTGIPSQRRGTQFSIATTPISTRRYRPMSPTVRRAVVVAVIAALALGGCSAVAEPAPTPSAPSLDQLVPLRDLDTLATPRDYVGPSTALLAAIPVASTEGRPAQSLPATVTSHDLTGDIPVEVTSTERVIALDIAGSIGATVYGLGFGATVVGRDISTTFAEAADVPVVTSGAHTISSEAILALRPDLIITDGTVGPIDVLLQLRDAGITIVFVDTVPSLDGVSALARDVASVFGAPAAGEQLATRLGAEIDTTLADIQAIAPTATGDRLRMLFLYLRGSSGIYYLFGEESGADVLITALGGIDVAGEIGLNGMRPMTDEALVAANPDLILVMSDGLASVGGVDGLLASKPAIALTRAGQNKRFVDMADGEILSFGPRTAGVLDALARAIYAPQS
jgi:iron complex transport system substrate-binding protein